MRPVVSNGTGIAIAAGLVAAGAIGAAYLLTRKSSSCGACSSACLGGTCLSGQKCQDGVCVPTSGTCGTGYYPCSTGVCCPLDDACAEAGGGCAAGSGPDPANPGCCVSACPPSCTADSNCSGCGADFVCENGECTKQVPTYLQGPVSATMLARMSYSETCCYLSSCKKCNGSYTPGNISFDVTVTDASGRPVAGVALNVSLGFSGATWQAVSDGMVYTSNPVPTDSSGSIRIIVTGTAAPDDFGNSGNNDYQCSACPVGTGLVDSGTLTAEIGSVSVNAPAYPNLSTIQVLVAASIYYAGTATYNACGCL